MQNHETLYVHDEATYNIKAAEAFIPYLFDIIKPKSVLDVGCGTGTWLSVLTKYGATRAIGIDGTYVDKEKLHIPVVDFIAYDLKKEIDLKEKFDLVICLEVAEHLPLDCADTIVKSLINHSEVILFSAALPKQGGQNHLNEQSFSYWVNKFKIYDYKFLDIFRNKIWGLNEIDVWYRQNSFLIVKEGHEIFKEYSETEILDFYHPIIYTDVVNENENLRIEKDHLFTQYESLLRGKQSISIPLKIIVKTILNNFKINLKLFL